MTAWLEPILAGLTAAQYRALERVRAAHERGARWCEWDTWDEVVTPGESPPWHCWLRHRRGEPC